MKTDRIKVLIIEDEKPSLRLLEAFLADASGRGRDFEVTGADSLAGALRLLESSGYDVIISDLFLPDSVGLETFTAVSALAGNTPVILLTGHENEAVAEEAVRRGAQDYLSKKAVNGENLSRAIMYSIERKSIEASLRASEERYRTLIDALDDMIIVVDRELRIIMSNSAFKKAAAEGDTSSAITGRRLPDGFSPLPAKTLELCGKALSEGKIITSEEPCLWNNRQGVLEIKCVPVLAGGKAQRAVIVARDITERKQMEHLKDDFASLVSHELRSPLTSVVAGLGIVLDGGGKGLDEDERKLLSVSYHDAQRLDRIITKILEMSRLEAGTSRFKKTMADVTQLADEVIAHVSARAKSRNIDLVRRYSSGKAETLLDTDGITEVFTNLVSNALKFTERGSIEVGVAEQGDLIECYVKDTGTGISREDQSRLFQKFRQFGKPVAEEEKGTGLGLFIVKEILRRHDGTLSVSSEPGKGTTFSFTLPKRREEAREAPQK